MCKMFRRVTKGRKGLGVGLESGIVLDSSGGGAGRMLDSTRMGEGGGTHGE